MHILKFFLHGHLTSFRLQDSPCSSCSLLLSLLCTLLFPSVFSDSFPSISVSMSLTQEGFQDILQGSSSSFLLPVIGCLSSITVATILRWLSLPHPYKPHRVMAAALFSLIPQHLACGSLLSRHLLNGWKTKWRFWRTNKMGSVGRGEHLEWKGL